MHPFWLSILWEFAERLWLDPILEDPTTTAQFQLRLASAKFANFSGEGESSESVINWLHDFTSTLFLVVAAPVSHAVRLAMVTMPLHSSARNWLLQLRKAKPDLSFNELAHAMVDQFLFDHS